MCFNYFENLQNAKGTPNDKGGLNDYFNGKESIDKTPEITKTKLKQYPNGSISRYNIQTDRGNNFEGSVTIFTEDDFEKTLISLIECQLLFDNLFLLHNLKIKKMKIAIIGGGIGGLTTALALQKSNQDVTLYESATEIKPVGAGIVMANNAMQIFDMLGVRQAIENAGCKISNIKITDKNLKTISLTDLTEFEKKYGVYNVAIHRADLQNILVDAIGKQHIQLSKRLFKIEKETDYTLTFEDGTIKKYDVLIGADGIHSMVRKQLFQSGILRDSKQRCWRGVHEFDWSTKYNNEALEAWGKGKRFGFVKINPKKIYWYAVANQNLVKNSPKIDELFSDFHPDTLRLIKETPKEKIHFSDIIDLKPLMKWHDGRACLIGDAAHATTPNLGQGACQAIEDAYVIGTLFERGLQAEEVFAQYEKLRIDKAHGIVNSSWKIGVISHWENSFAIWLRNTLLKSMPQSAKNKQLENVFEIHQF